MDCNKPDFDLFIYNSNNLNNPNDSTNKNYKYNYTCTDVETMNCTTHNTQWNDGGQGNVIFLDRHNIKCPPNKGLKQMQLKRNSTDLSKYRYDYTCCDIDFDTKIKVVEIPDKYVKEKLVFNADYDNNSFIFNGINNYITIHSDHAPVLDESPFTIEFIGYFFSKDTKGFSCVNL